MPIIALILSTLFFWAIYWFVRMDGLDKIRDAMARRRNEKRRIKALESQRTAPLQAVDDPRDAAIVLMLLIARSSDAPTREQYETVEATARSVFGFEHDLTERMTQGRFIAARAESFEQAVGLFANLLRSRLTDGNLRSLTDYVAFGRNR